MGVSPAMLSSVSSQVSDEERTSLAEGRLGQVLMDKWELESLIGMGGVASVFSARHRNGHRVAIKILHPELATYPEVRERFIQEGYAANQVDHPGVVKVIDDGHTEDGIWFLVMELLQGETLEQMRNRGPLPPRKVLQICHEVLDVLATAHKQGVVHRDVKPENIFIARDRAKLFDFGIARFAEARRSHVTQPGSTLGTPAFMPPEQARGRLKEVDAQSDLWALGATMFWVLSGNLPRGGSTPQEELLAAMTAKVPPLQSVTSGLSRAVIQLIDRAVHLEKSRRWSSAEEMQREVQRILEHPDLNPDANGKRTSSAAARLWSSVLGPELPPRRQKQIAALAAFGLTMPGLFAAFIVLGSEPGPGSDPTRGSHVVAAAPVVVGVPAPSAELELPAALQPMQAEPEPTQPEPEVAQAPSAPRPVSAQQAAAPASQAARAPSVAPPPRSAAGPSAKPESAAGASGKSTGAPAASATESEAPGTAAGNDAEEADGVVESVAASTAEPEPSAPPATPSAGDKAEGGEEKENKSADPPALDPSNPY